MTRSSGIKVLTSMLLMRWLRGKTRKLVVGRLERTLDREVSLGKHGPKLTIPVVILDVVPIWGCGR